MMSATVALAIGLSACGSDEPPRTPPRDFYGVNGVILRAWSSQGKAELVDRHLAQVKESGAAFVRATLGWQLVEPLPPVRGLRQYEFDDTDRWMEALAKHDLHWSLVGIGVPTPAWAADPTAPLACGGQRPPARIADFAAVMRAMAARYGSDGRFWELHPELPFLPVRDYEIWNAPNHGGDWCPTPDPDRYADLYAASQDAIEAADPAARVLVGGLGAFETQDPGSVGGARVHPREFLEGMLTSRPELAQTIDAVGIHVYAEDAQGVLDGVVDFRQAVDDAGLDGVDLIWNEVGWPTDGLGGFPPKTEAERAELLGELTRAALEMGCGIASFAPHTWVTPELDPRDPEDWFGIADPATGEPYPSALAFREAIAGEAPPVTEPACGA